MCVGVRAHAAAQVVARDLASQRDLQSDDGGHPHAEPRDAVDRRVDVEACASQHHAVHLERVGVAVNQQNAGALEHGRTVARERHAE